MEPTETITGEVLHVGNADSATGVVLRDLDGVRVTTVADAERARERLGPDAFDCVVSEASVDSLNTIRDAGDGTPVLFVTDDPARANEALAAGVADVLVRSDAVDLRALLERRVERLCREARRSRTVSDDGGDPDERTDYAEILTQIRENARDVIWVTPPYKSSMDFVSDSYEDVYGHSKKRLRERPRSFVEAVHPEDRERVEAALERQREDPGSYDETYRVVHPDGEVRWVHDRASGVYDEDGTLRRVVGIVTDITERKERERELELKNRAMDEAPVGITISDPATEDNPLVYVNDGFETMTGYDRDEALGRNCRFLQGGNTDPEPVARLRAAIDDTEPVTVELRNYRADGTEFWNEVTVAPVFDDEGRLTNYVGFQQDVTDRKERERELELKNRVIQEAPIGVTIHDATDPDYPVTYANEGLVELTGYDPVQLQGDLFATLRSEDTDPDRVAELVAAMDEERATSLVVLFSRRDGTPFWSRVSVAPVTDEAGAVTHVVGFQQDVTETKEHEQEVERRLDEFGDILAAELRTPIVEARDGLAAARESESTTDLESVEEWLDRAEGLVEDLTTVHSFSVKDREVSERTGESG